MECPLTHACGDKLTRSIKRGLVLTIIFLAALTLLLGLWPAGSNAGQVPAQGLLQSIFAGSEPPPAKDAGPDDASRLTNWKYTDAPPDTMPSPTKPVSRR